MLRYLLKAGYSYSALNTTRSTLSCMFDSLPFGEEPLVIRFMKSAYIINSPLARYVKTWDVNIVFKKLLKMIACNIHFQEQLTFKLITPLALISIVNLIYTISILYEYRSYSPRDWPALSIHRVSPDMSANITKEDWNVMLVWKLTSNFLPIGG